MSLILLDKPEILSQRHLFGRTYDLGNGQFNSRISTGPVHFFDKYHRVETTGKFQEFDWRLKWDDIDRGWRIDRGNAEVFIPEFANGEADFFDCFGDKENHVRMTANCNPVRGRLILAEELQNEGLETESNTDCVLFSDAISLGIDLIYILVRRSLCKLIRIRRGFSPTSDLKIKFDFNFAGDIYRALDKSDIKELKNSAYKLEKTGKKNLDSTKKCFIKDVACDDYTIIEPFQIWEKRSPLIINQNRQFITADFEVKNGKISLTKIIPASFFANCSSDVFCDTTTGFYATNDGLASRSGATGSYTWAQMRSGSGSAGSDATLLGCQAERYSGNNTWYLYRPMLTFTNNLSAGSTISAATVNIYKHASGGTLTANLVDCTTRTTLQSSDFTKAGSTAQASNTFTVAQWASGWNSFTGNSAMISGVPINGSYYCAIRDGSYDLSGTAPSSSSQENYIQGESSYYAGISYDPYQNLVWSSSGLFFALKLMKTQHA